MSMPSFWAIVLAGLVVVGSRPTLRAEDLAPTHPNVPYGPHSRQVLDFFQVKAPTANDAPTPLVVFIHGGGWGGGDKSHVQGWQLPRFLNAGVAVAAIDYRYWQQAKEAGVQPPVRWPIADAARAVQFLRSKADEWKFDKTRIGVTGASAGACSSLWLALHDDLADPKSDDPIARESTRVACAAVLGAQTSLDPKQMREWIPNSVYGGHAFGFREPNEPRDGAFPQFYEGREKVLPWIREYSPYEHASADDPPIFLQNDTQKDPVEPGVPQADPTHSAIFGLMLKRRLDGLGVECHLSYPARRDPAYSDIQDFLIRKLAPQPSANDH